MRTRERLRRVLRLVRGSGHTPPLERVARARELVARLGLPEALRVLGAGLREARAPDRRRPHPPSDEPPAAIPGPGPRFSVLVAGPADAATEASLAAQSYPHWELCREDVAGDRVAALERARARATGDWLLEVRAGDRLGPHALAWFASALVEDPPRDLLYADEDVVDSTGARRKPRFKPAWAPHTLEATHYIGRPWVARAERVAAAGGFRPGPAPDHDLLLRVSADARAVVHLPKILYHARQRLGVPPVRQPAPPSRQASVALLVPTRDRRDLLERCLGSHWRLSAYPRCEVVVVDDGSQAPTRDWLRALADAGRITLVRRDAAFNFSALINAGAQATQAEVLVLLNNDVEVLAPGWIEAMLSYALRDDVGAVGALLRDASGSVQHAGVVLGVGPDRVAAEAHAGEPPGSAGYEGRVLCPQTCSAVTGACLMVRRDRFEAVGGLDEALAVSFNDVDLCLRLAEQGWHTVYTPFASLRHLGSASRSRATAPEELARFRARWGPRLARDPFYSPQLSRERADFTWT